MPSPLLDTKSLFISLLKKIGCDLVLDIGSRDGKQALLFRDTLPGARVVAFEANPQNYRKMAGDPALAAGQIGLSPCAVSHEDGRATFHIAAANYQAEETAENNLGISSLLVHPGVKTLQDIEVETVRLDSFLCRPEYRECRAVALWIDVESAEYWVLEGMRGVAERVQLIHVETARTQMRLGQKTCDEVARLLAASGFVEIGNNLETDSAWGDVVFVRQTFLEQRGSAVRAAVRISRLTKAININQWAVRLKRVPWLYRALRSLFLRRA